MVEAREDEEKEKEEAAEERGGLDGRGRAGISMAAAWLDEVEEEGGPRRRWQGRQWRS